MENSDTDSMTSVAADRRPEISEDLVRRLKEIIEWRKTGVAALPALQAYVDANLAQLGDVDTLRIAEDKTLMEAARLVVSIAGKDTGC
jgi:hypothetical protein